MCHNSNLNVEYIICSFRIRFNSRSKHIRGEVNSRQIMFHETKHSKLNFLLIMRSLSEILHILLFTQDQA